MSPRKLSAADKQEILRLYQQTVETTSTLAEHYGVSSSTISRFLKQNLSESDYEVLIQQKRLGRTPHRAIEARPNLPLDDNNYDENEASAESAVIEATEKQIKRRRSPQPVSREQRRGGDEMRTASDESDQLETPALDQSSEDTDWPLAELEGTDADLAEDVEVITLEAMLGEDIADEDEDLEDLEDNWDEADDPITVQRRSDEVQVLPLSQASFPPTAYLVIDVAANLIVRPLKDFAELGHLPDEEVRQKTLPVFDNQKIARRFSNRSQRVIKVPDCSIFERTSSYLQAKGITRILLDGQVYSLNN